MSMKRIVCLGEVLLRLGAPGHEPLLRSPRLETSVGGAEANVAVALAALGLDAALVSTLPANPLGDACLGELRRHGVDTAGIARAPGRLGLYFLTHGAMQRASEVVYDRAGSAFATADPSCYDWPRLLAEGSWLHVTGITLALGAHCEQAVEAALRTALAQGVRVSFDCNFRPSLWRGREQEGRRLLAATARQADLLFASSADAELLLGVDTKPQRDSERISAMAAGLFAECPRLRWLAGTHRVVHSAGRHELSGFLAERGSADNGGRLRLWRVTGLRWTESSIALARAMPMPLACSTASRRHWTRCRASRSPLCWPLSSTRSRATSSLCLRKRSAPRYVRVQATCVASQATSRSRCQ